MSSGKGVREFEIKSFRVVKVFVSFEMSPGAKIPSLPLNNGLKMPLLGLGTYKVVTGAPGKYQVLNKRYFFSPQVTTEWR